MVGRALLLAATVLALSGCQDSLPPLSDALEPPTLGETLFVMQRPAGPYPAGTVVEEFHLSGTTSVSATREPEPQLSYPVQEGASAIFVELRWDDPIHDLDVWTAAPVDDCRLDGLPPNEFDDLGCGTDPYFCVYDVGAWANCDGDFGVPDAPSRLLIRGSELATVLQECGSPCDWSAKPMSGYYAAPGIAWTLEVLVFYGPGPWDDLTRPHAYLQEGKSPPFGYPMESLDIHTVSVPAAVVAELAWSSVVPADWDLVVLLRQGGCDNASVCRYESGSWQRFPVREGSSSAPDSPVRLVLPQEEFAPFLDGCVADIECDWRVAIVTHDCEVQDPLAPDGSYCNRPQMQFRLAATVFYGEVPVDWSLLEQQVPEP